ncbi:hypothetical protein HMPREF0201_02430 [Cedecea davisae DSM 4568]|uniref:Uncharacterized protein n=1 Tax=Cedecea davisae DSM 4568 TaxID=566551 RepID=S3JU93_9ENTR|nr:hypothetical protein HMPREF0201_02430 [Cedecea davisae DSM 4568]
MSGQSIMQGNSVAAGAVFHYITPAFALFICGVLRGPILF